MVAGTHSGGTDFGVADRAFILAVGLPNQVVVTLPGEVSFRLVTLSGVNHCQCPFIGRK